MSDDELSQRRRNRRDPASSEDHELPRWCSRFNALPQQIPVALRAATSSPEEPVLSQVPHGAQKK
jgi:hypothetical protein